MNENLTCKFINDLNKYGSLLSPFYSNGNIINNLNLNPQELLFDQIYTIDLKYYLNIIDSVQYHLDYNPSTKKRTKNIIVYPTLCNHFHDCSPKYKYLAIRCDLIDDNDKIFYRAKLSPYYCILNNRIEINMGIVFKNSKDIFTMGTYKKYARHIKDINYTNLSPSHIYIHALDNKFFKNGLDKTHPNYTNDISYLNEYEHQINNLYQNLNLSFDEFGILNYNHIFNLNDIYNQTKNKIKYKSISSYIINHHE